MKKFIKSVAGAVVSLFLKRSIQVEVEVLLFEKCESNMFMSNQLQDYTNIFCMSPKVNEYLRDIILNPEPPKLKGLPLVAGVRVKDIRVSYCPPTEVSPESYLYTITYNYYKYSL